MMQESATLPVTTAARVLVVGDVMLDRYWFGDVARISPEAPVPVVKIENVDERLGGAANVARNCVALGAQASLLSVVGDDEAGQTLARLLAASSIDASLHQDAKLKTTVKLRVVARQQQLLRIDFENSPNHEVLQAKLAEYGKRLAACNMVILSDYGKGGLAHITEMIGLAHASGKTVLADPKGDDYERYAGVDVITPNRAELKQVVGQWRGEEDLERRVRELCDRLRIGALLLTRSEEGMTLFSHGQTIHVPAQAREVYDVSGAGDTVIATLAVMMASGASLPDAMVLANRAAGVVVGKLGTATCSLAELQAA